MLYRDHRGGLAESMETVVELAPTIEAIAEHLKADPYLRGRDLSKIKVEPYAFDARIQWNTYIVTVDGMAVGFTNGPVGRSAISGNV